MSSFTPEQAKYILESYEKLQQELIAIAREMFVIEGKIGPTEMGWIDIDLSEFASRGVVGAEIETYGGCGYYDTKYIEFPLKYLWGNFLEEARNEYEERVRIAKENAIEQAKKAAKEKEKRQEEADRARYLELKARFEGGGDI